MTGFRAIALAATLLTAGPAVAEAPWRPIWTEEFNGSGPDAMKWSIAEDCGGGGNHERQCYAKANVAVSGGRLRLTARRETTTGPAEPWDGRSKATATLDYSSGKVLTKGRFALRYGRVEVRARTPAGQGVWPAIWMLPDADAYGDWPRSGEIDILETINLGAPCRDCKGGRENRIFGTIHFADAAGGHRQHGGQVVPPASADGFHVYGVDWSPGLIVWSVDGRPYFTARATDWTPVGQAPRAAPFDQPFHLILNLAFGGDWPEDANAKGVDPAAVPAVFEIDWVRVSQR